MERRSAEKVIEEMAGQLPALYRNGGFEMINTNITIKLYELDELGEKARARAIDEHRNFMLETMYPEDFKSGDPQYDTPEELEKAYNAEYDYISMNDEPVIESIECNEYLFFEDGELAHVTHYCGKHPLSGQTWLKYHGSEYRIA